MVGEVLLEEGEAVTGGGRSWDEVLGLTFGAGRFARRFRIDPNIGCARYHNWFRTVDLAGLGYGETFGGGRNVVAAARVQDLRETQRTVGRRVLARKPELRVLGTADIFADGHRRNDIPEPGAGARGSFDDKRCLPCFYLDALADGDVIAADHHCAGRNGVTKSVEAESPDCEHDQSHDSAEQEP